MKLTVEEIIKVKTEIKENGYDRDELCKLFEDITSDYIRMEDIYKKYVVNGSAIIDDSFLYVNPQATSVSIDASFNGEIESCAFRYEGTKKMWEEIKDKGIFKDVPCINCRDGKYIQKL